MIMDTRLAYEYLTRVGAGTICDKHWVTRVGGVIRESIAVGRPSYT